MIHRLEQKRVEIDEIAGHVQSRDLSPAVRKRFVAARKPVQQQRAVARSATDSHDIGAGGKLARLNDRFPKDCLLAFGQSVVLPKIEEKWVQQGTASIRLPARDTRRSLRFGPSPIRCEALLSAPDNLLLVLTFVIVCPPQVSHSFR